MIISTTLKSVLERYQFKPFLGSSHSWTLDKLKELKTTSRVLDVGPGSGAIGAALTERGISEIYAVEIDAATRERLKDCYKQIEETLDPFTGKQFDLILLLDVLEHLANPEEFLLRVSQMLAKDGSIIISVPNIAHWSVRALLLCGLFPQYDRGILDRTHFQFFTRRRFRRMIDQTPGLKLIQEGSSIEPVELLIPEQIYQSSAFVMLSKLRIKLANLIPGLLAYQHLGLIKRIE